MDFSLAIGGFSLLTPAAQKAQLLATNRDAESYYGLQLTPDDAEMLMQTAQKAIRAQELVQFGGSITPRLIRWFLPSGYFGRGYAAQIAELTEAFYQLKGDLQALYDTADDPECVLSDNAILNYMYQFYVSPTCGGDAGEMLAQAERILIPAMRKLLEVREAERKQHNADLGDPEMRMLYADKIAQEAAADTYESEYEQEQYDAMKQELVLSLPDGEVTAANAAVLTGKLLQMSNGAIYTDEGNTIQIHDRKLDALEDIIEGMNGRPLLLAYWFKHDLQRITERLTQIGVPYERLDSEASIKRWNAGKIQVGLAHPASTGHGLNLQDGGNTICWFSPIWSLELYQQTNARLFRQGQKASTVVVTHIVTKGTVDSRVLKALEEKDRIQEALIAAVKAEVKR